MVGKVAIVTGAGRGVGRAEYLELASQGVAIVVNDFAPPGEDNPADDVVKEIEAAGGRAVAHSGDVADWDTGAAMVQLAIDTFGSFDILVNNAGVLRDRMLFNMSEDDFDLVIRVHLKGHFVMMRHAAEHWRNASKAAGASVYGRIINTSSESGLRGAVGQTNYAAAKGGIIQMTIAAAQALSRYGVTANAIAPRARTRMTESLGGFDTKDGDFEVFAPENVSPLVAYLASPQSERVSGQVFIVWGRQISLVGGPAVEHSFDTDANWTPEKVDDAITSFYETREPITDGFILRY